LFLVIVKNVNKIWRKSIYSVVLPFSLALVTNSAYSLNT